MRIFCILHLFSNRPQDDSHAAFDNPLLDIFGDAKAFRLPDILWQTSTKVRLSLHEVLANQTLFGCAILTFKAQKNGDNCATRLFTANSADSPMCFIRCLIRIVRRFLRLVGGDLTKPLCICLDPLGKLRYITSSDISYVLRRAASAVYKLDPVLNAAALSPWSSHSFCIGTSCVLLHAQGFTDVQIMWLLHWKSSTFMTYLCNVAILS